MDIQESASISWTSRPQFIGAAGSATLRESSSFNVEQLVPENMTIEHR